MSIRTDKMVRQNYALDIDNAAAVIKGKVQTQIFMIWAGDNVSR